MSTVSILALCVSGAMLLFAILTFGRNAGKDRRTASAEEKASIDNIRMSLIRVNDKLDNLCVTTNETRTDIKKMDTSINEIDRRMTIIEQSVKAAWKRIDELRGVKSE